MSSPPFALGTERIVHLPSYRWLSIVPFDIDAVPSEAEALFAVLLSNEVFNRPYIFEGRVHGPFAAGEIQRGDYVRKSGAEARRSILDAANAKASWMDAPDPPSQEVVDEITRELRAWPDAAAAFHLLVDCYLDEGRRHDTGWILWEFDEHIILDPALKRGWFVVLGMD